MYLGVLEQRYAYNLVWPLALCGTLIIIDCKKMDYDVYVGRT
jgi:hypothetical protein